MIVDSRSSGMQTGRASLGFTLFPDEVFFLEQVSSGNAGSTFHSKMPVVQSVLHCTTDCSTDDRDIDFIVDMPVLQSVVQIEKSVIHYVLHYSSSSSHQRSKQGDF